MIKLVTVAEVKTRLVSSLTGVDALVEQGIEAAQYRIESALACRLDKDTYEHVFYLDDTVHNGIQPGKRFRLFLECGFVVEDSITVSAGEDPDDLEELEDTDWSIDLEKGVVYVKNTYVGQYVKVEYSAGFELVSSTVTPTPPGWLKEAILSYVPVVFNMSQPSNRSDEAEKLDAMSAEHAMAIINAHTRNVGFTLAACY